MIATLQNNTPSLISGSVYINAGVQHPVAGLSLRSDPELAQIGAYRVHVVQPPANFEQTGTELVWTGSRVEQRPLGRELTPEEIAARDKAKAEDVRRAAYQSEADPIFFMAQRGEATIEEWTTKVAEIKARYPYPPE